ncbi:NCS2 family permease [Ruania alba]|uniref:Putative MFS transporter, AGZA family, xanthine/uracil permease n=1 Tax=Ruania alba TaxID=648782 RepID=A0A1H5NIE9_9MICO|nr:NCS2 family permease [Ruania alba]SEF00498.1 putative MFS transporter, AGZA family, xanthine/uracil permease [Ruania alba]
MSTDTPTARPRALERWFRIQQRGSSLRIELIAGFTTFATMAYVLAVVPGILAEGGVPRGPVTVAIIVMAALSTLAMGIVTNRPLALAPGLGSVAFIAFTLGAVEGIPWQTSMGMVFISGLVFVLLTVLKLREAISSMMPKAIKLAIGAGVGLFICFIGFRSGGLSQASESSNALVVGDLGSPEAILTLIGLALVLGLHLRKVPGGLLIAIVATTIIGIPMGVTTVPDTLWQAPTGLGEVAFGIDILGALKLSFFPFIFALFVSDFFSTFGTLFAVGSRGNFLDSDGNFPEINKPFLVDSISTVAGSLVAVPVMTTYVESTSGVEAGGRTGLTSITTGALFLATLLFTPLALMIPSQATAPVLILVGLLMLAPLREIDMTDLSEALPAFLAVVVTIFTFNIGTGISAGIVAYVVVKVLSGEARSVPGGLWILLVPLVYYFTTLA